MGRSNGDGASDASAALVFLPKRKGTSGRDGASAIEARDRRRAEAHAARRVTKLSNSQKRKLKKLAEEERKRSERASVMAMLEANVADERALGLMRATTSLGARETAKEKMRRALKAERAGVTLDDLDDARLTKRPKAVGREDEEQSEDESESEREAAPKSNEYKGLHHEVFRGCSFVVPVQRTGKINDSREGLPIVQEEHEIVDAINTNPVTVICGATGCGKTTQVPQFLYEAGYGDPDCDSHPGAVAVTQPRRVAVTSTARRVAEELNVPLGGDVGYQVRYDKNVGDNPRIKFMTDGILLREVQADFLLRKYSVVIIDEAHERSVNTDILLGLLSRIVPLRAALAAEGKAVTPLRLVVMSATLRVEEFVENRKLCPTPPALLQVATRQFPVTVHFSRKTEHADYVGAATKKVLAIHRKLPPGGILVFLTGQREVEMVCRKLRDAYPLHGKRVNAAESSDDEDEDSGDAMDDTYDVDAIDAGGEDLGGDDDEPDFDGEDDMSDAASDISEEDEVLVMGGEGVGEEEAAEAEAAWTRANAPSTGLGADKTADGPGGLNVLPLYALLPPNLQQRVFQASPDGSRMVIVATNVAETSLTIPGIRYVVDAGRAKERVYERDASLSRFQVGWVSKASADQRAGRAGRTSPGHCYRLFSSAHFVDEMKAHADPQILGVPVEGVVLQMRAMGIDKVVNFPFISPPERSALAAAEKTLQILGAVEKSRHGEEIGPLTDLGRAMAVLPISPRHSRMLFAAAQSGVGGCLSPAIAIAAALSLDSPFLRNSSETVEDDEEEGEAKATPKGPPPHVRFHHPASDALSAAQALLAYDACKSSDAVTFCSTNRLHEKTMREMSDLRRQLKRLVVNLATTSKFGDDVFPNAAVLNELDDSNQAASSMISLPPGGDVERTLRQALCAGWADRIAPNEKSTKATRYVPALLDAAVFLHPTSSLHRSSPDYVVYTDLLQTDKRAYIVGATGIEPEWLIQHCDALVDQGAMLADPAPRYVSREDRVVGWTAPRFGPHRWDLPLNPIAVNDVDTKCAVFATALLSGAVSPPMADLREKLAAKPLLASRPEGRAQKRVVDLLGALKRVGGGICTRAQLRQIWMTRGNDRYLYPELKAWMRAGKGYALEQAWLKIVQGVVNYDEGKERKKKKGKK
ncbi:predicted protein [Ostreococcus lucimarinus CCE9901]|uniref:RNA helicase n=1 Tax=Ostreococcus lucimarinus (strain CCE9901) TaxID=436017 RepID=A4RXW8_OSTLU|nr:predicted protein [Ostreococcus lucimarinus CCE9901]ABO96118.1 predicted protein [Ostreococcus lucimarinus CCE9901]|eukprot:XP_001417825.1 predicted protein [Ostreococcus lucimarinus CCE9901]